MRKFIEFMNVAMKFYSIYYMVFAILMIFGVYELSKTSIVVALLNLSFISWFANIEYNEK